MRTVRPTSIFLVLLSATASGQQTAPASRQPASQAFPPPAELRVVKNVPFARYGSRELHLDLYLPHEIPTRPIPGVLVLRGGGWRQGDKEGFAFVAGYLAKSGIAAASIEYRTSSEAPFPAALHDAKAAVRWLRTNATRYGIDSLAIGALGGSAGGHLVVMLAATGHISTFDDHGGESRVSSQVGAVVAMAPATEFAELLSQPSFEFAVAAIKDFVGAPMDSGVGPFHAASPVTYVTHTAAPLLLIHGTADQVVPYSQSVRLEAQYKKAGAPVQLVRLDGVSHAFWNDTRWFTDVMDRAVAFLKTTLAHAPR